MYDFIRGELVRRSPTEVVLEAGGIGYKVHIPLSTYDKLADDGEVTLLTLLHVREDLLRLYGFATQEERRAFVQLCSVRGVGPNVALGLLSGLSVHQFWEAVMHQQVSVLESVRGVGRKTAERIVVDLKGIAEEYCVPTQAGAEAGGSIMDATAALQSLGYSRGGARSMARKAINALGPDASLEEIIREALKRT